MLEALELRVGERAGNSADLRKVAVDLVLGEKFAEEDVRVAGFCVEGHGGLLTELRREPIEAWLQQIAAHAAVAGRRAFGGEILLEDDDGAAGVEKGEGGGETGVAAGDDGDVGGLG